MATNDGATTELFTGWSSVVHQPEDEPEESELPSTVDIGALTAEPPDPGQPQNAVDSDSESDDSDADSSNSDASDASQESCSHSDSSDSDSSSSSQESSSRSPSPEFSVTSSQTNGLRLTIATIRKSTSSPINSAKKNQLEDKVKGSKKSTSSSSSDCSTDSDSDSDSRSEEKNTQSPLKQCQNSAGLSRKPVPVGKLPTRSIREQERQSPLNKSRPSNVVNKDKDNLSIPKLRLTDTNTNSNFSSKERSTPQRDREGPAVGKKIGSTNSNNGGNKERDLNDPTNKDKEATIISKARVSGTIASQVKDSVKEKEKGCSTSARSKGGPIGKLRSSAILSNSKDKTADKASHPIAKGRAIFNTSSTKEASANSRDSISTSRFKLPNSSNLVLSGNTNNKDKDREGSFSKDVNVKQKGGNEKIGKMADGKNGKKKVRTKRRSKKMASVPLSRSSTYSSSESESSVDLLPASCSLQEIRQEDLAAILPDQSECNDFNDFDKNDKDSPTTGDMSGSDMELPQQAINSLIQRTTESSSDGEGHQLPNPQTLFANSLLQQFVASNPLLSPPAQTLSPLINDSLSPSKSLTNASITSASSSGVGKESNDSNHTSRNELSEESATRKRRGRPRKGVKARKEQGDGERVKGKPDFSGGPNVSPDSGIQNSPDHVSSPEPALSPNIRSKSSQIRDDVKRKSSSNLEGKMHSKFRSSACSSRNNSQERHSSRIASQEKRSNRNTSPNKQGNKNVLQEKSTSRNASQEKHTVINSSQEKLSNKNVSHEKSASRNSSQEKHGVKTADKCSKITPLEKLPVKNISQDVFRRKVGRPPGRKPGRPPKYKESTDAKSGCEKTVQNVKAKGKQQCVNPPKQFYSKAKSITLKVPKILHTKHKQKHKKRKFRILKPLVSSDPKINQEIEKLIVDFVKFCVIATKQPKDNVPDQILKTLKKVTKKRRTTDHVEKKKKKQSLNTTVNKVNNSNEQCLPLKKRHYKLASNSTECQKSETEESKDNVPDKLEDTKIEAKGKSEKREKAKEKDHKLTPKYVPVIKSHINNNEYEVKDERTEKEPGTPTEESNQKFPKEEDKSQDDKIVPATTPKKRHRLENLNSSMENLHGNVDNLPEIKTESAAIEEKFEKLKSTVTVESYINELKIKRNLIGQKTKSENEDDLKKKEKKSECVTVKNEESQVLKVEKTVQVSPESTKKKVRKRRAYNRTGFPTVKRKKKKCITTDVSVVAEEKIKPNTPVCDRVPKEGEEYSKFLQRSAENSVQDLTTINAMDKSPTDGMSECESLPQEERTDFDFEDSSRSESVADNLSESLKSKRSDGEDNETLSLLESSIERLKSRLDQKKRKRSKDLKNLPVETSIYPKRRRREDSPASSVPSIEGRLSASASGDELPKKSKKAPRWRKKYLVAGLFSDYYKEDESKRIENSKSTRNLIYNQDDHPYGLLPPPYHCGKYLRCRKVDFQLPYDLWWQHTNSQLPGRDVVPSWNYRKIRTNVYNVKNNGGACEPQSCNCKQSSNCGDDCINRLVLAECPGTHRCNNQKIQKHDWAPGLEKFMTESKGWGVRTKEPIKQGEFILEYVGEVVSDQEFKERMNSIYVNDTHHYCLHLDGGLVIDGHRMGGDGRFVNHSCQPNCEMQKWSVNGQFRMALFALRDIKPFEELAYDYNFSLFNTAEGQECKCESDNCRGVIGGKTQRTRQLPESSAVPKNPGRVGRPRKTEAKKKTNTTKDSNLISSNPQPPSHIVPQIQVKPMSHQQKCFILEHHCFLLRNLTKVRKVRDRSLSLTSSSRQQTATPTDSSAFLNQLNALQKPRNIKTRRIAQVEDDPELNKTVKLAAILKDILETITCAKDDNGFVLSTSLMQLPSKRKHPDFYQRVSDPIDLSTIEQNIATGVYKTPQAFDEDMSKLFSGFLKFYGRTTNVGVAAAKLKKIFNETKQQSLARFKDVLGEKPPPTFVNNKKKNDEEDIIRCICGIPRDEGLMIQCERCMVWQHIECVNADASAASYHCEICVPRSVDYEIPMDEFTEHGHRYYMTLMRGDLQLRQGDTVYVLRDIPISGTDKKHTYETIGKIDYTELDIFRIERLWKDKDTGKRFAYGHHYLRPHETFHEPTRKFFPNEVMRVPLYEAVPVELVMEHCWVMDVNTFCKGRPVGAQEQHVYICEYRVDKGAKMFSKVSKSKFPICTKSFAFEHFETRLKVSRTYCPHEVDETFLKNAGARKKRDEKEKDKGLGNGIVMLAQTCSPPVQRTPAEQKSRLNRILLNLLSKIPTKQVLDVSYLLEGGRRRKKQETKQ